MNREDENLPPMLVTGCNDVSINEKSAQSSTIKNSSDSMIGLPSEDLVGMQRQTVPIIDSGLQDGKTFRGTPYVSFLINVCLILVWNRYRIIP